MDNLIKPNDVPLEPDLVCSKDGKILKLSERENVRINREVVFSVLPRLLADFLASRRF